MWQNTLVLLDYQLFIYVYKGFVQYNRLSSPSSFCHLAVPYYLSLLAVGFPPKKANTNEVDWKGTEPVSMHKNLSTEKISLS